MLVETKSKNENGVQYEAQIFDDPTGGYSVNYLKDGEIISSKQYSQSLVMVQMETTRWMNSIGVING